MPLTDAEIEEKLKEDHGLLWKPDDSQRADIHSLDGFAINFMGHFKPLFTKVAAKRAPTIFTHMVLLEKDDVVLFAAAGFRAAEMNGERGEGRPVRHLDRRLDGQLLAPQSGNLAAPAAAGGKGDHQDRPVAEIAQAVGRAGRQQLCQHVAGDRPGAFATPRPNTYRWLSSQPAIVPCEEPLWLLLPDFN
ncbi:hypothetical protein HFN76_35590 [Rhizobium laguerreae]|nr:hypothetical protein [Rhizobium laguerreae]